MSNWEYKRSSRTIAIQDTTYESRPLRSSVGDKARVWGSLDRWGQWRVIEQTTNFARFHFVRERRGRYRKVCQTGILTTKNKAVAIAWNQQTFRSPSRKCLFCSGEKFQSIFVLRLLAPGHQVSLRMRCFFIERKQSAAALLNFHYETSAFLSWRLSAQKIDRNHSSTKKQIWKSFWKELVWQCEMSNRRQKRLRHFRFYLWVIRRKARHEKNSCEFLILLNQQSFFREQVVNISLLIICLLLFHLRTNVANEFAKSNLLRVFLQQLIASSFKLISNNMKFNYA